MYGTSYQRFRVPHFSVLDFTLFLLLSVLQLLLLLPQLWQTGRARLVYLENISLD